MINRRRSTAAYISAAPRFDPYCVDNLCRRSRTCVLSLARLPAERVIILNDADIISRARNQLTD